MTATSVIPGYRVTSVEVTVGAGNVTANIAVPVAADCTAPGYGYRQLAAESFDGTGAPAGWTVQNQTDGGGWAFEDSGGRGNLTGGAGNFAMVDSDALGTGKTQDSWLVTPVYDFTGVSAPTLRFNSDYRAFSNSVADVDVTVDGGATWATVWHYTTEARRGPRVEEVALPSAAGAATAQIRFRYQGTFAWWWEVDNVVVMDKTCAPRPGGLVVGVTTDKNTGAGLNGVTVASQDAPAEKGLSAPTPDDPALSDGFYWLFSSLTGTHPFTASKSPYQPLTKDIEVTADTAKRADFALKVGRITITPGEIESHQPYGTTRSTTIKVTNSGSAPATVTLVERAGAITMAGLRGGAVREYQIPGGASKKYAGNEAGRKALLSGATTLIDPVWGAAADYPTAIYDNQAVNLGGKIYSVGGASSPEDKQAYAYDPGTDAWTRLPDLPHARSQPSVAVVNGKVYAIGGWGDTSDPDPTVDVFDPATNSWSTVAGAVNPAPRAAAGTAVVNGKVYLVGGCIDGSCPDSDNLVIFDPESGTFSTGAKYPHLGSYIGCGGIAGKVYCAGGSTTVPFSDGYAYDPAGNSWTRIADMPLQLWASQYSAASGMLIMAGGIANSMSTSTNRAVAYDPVANAWTELPAAPTSTYRGGGACGFYKIGGRAPGNVASPEVEHLGGLDMCAEAADASWLSTDPVTVTVPAGASRNVKVTLAATPEAGVLQPGVYEAKLGIQSDTPYAVPDVSVEMHVSPPPSWGKIQGTVTGVTCNGVTVGVPATVRVNLASVPGVGYTLKADRNGRYAYWVPKGRYQVIVAKDDWIPEVQVQRIEAGFVSTLNFELEPVNPCAGRVGGL